MKARHALLALPILAIAELALHRYFAGRAPSFDAWSEVRPAVEAFATPGDLIVVAPAWADPLARAELGDDWMPLAHVARAGEDRFEHAVEISILGQSAPALEGWREIGRTTQGSFRLRRLENPAFRRVITDFVSMARPPVADVTFADTPCPWNPRSEVMNGGFGGHPTFPRQRFLCPQGTFFHVGETVIADELYLPRRCLWAHPPNHGAPLTIRFTGVKLGDTLEGHAGMPWLVERERKGAPVTLAARVDGDAIGEMTHEDGEGWKGFSFALGSHAGAASATVELRVTTPRYEHRHLCVEAVSR